MPRLDFENLKSANRTFYEQGALLYPQLFLGAELDSLRHACESARKCFLEELDRNHPDQKNVNRMENLHNPRWHRKDKAHWKTILECVADPRCLGPVEQIFQGTSLFRCTQLFFNPRFQSSEGDWHRDLQFLLPDEEQVEAHIAQAQATGIQLQIALVDNDDVEYVPFSASRYDTPEEFFIRCADNRSHNQEAGMPNAMRVALRAGDALIFNPNGLHRGRYDVDRPRRTLMLTYTPRDLIVADTFSAQPWTAQENFLDGLSRRAQVYFEEFIAVYQPYWKEQQKP